MSGLTYLCMGFVRREDAVSVLDSVRARLNREDIPCAALTENPHHIVDFLDLTQEQPNDE